MKFLKNLKAILTSSKFFSNWWVLPFFFLTGANTFNVKCRDEGMLNLNRFEFKRILIALRDSLINSIDCNSRTFTAINGISLPIDKLSSLSYDVLRLFSKGLFSKGDCIFDLYDGVWIHRVSGLKFKELRTSIIDVLCLNHYPLDDIDLRGREVVDVGAYVGDSTLYFLYRGAEKVIAIEPHRGAYEEMLYNLRINEFQHKVIAVNAALGGRRGYCSIPVDLDVNETAVLNYLDRNAKEGIDVEVITLEDVLRYVKEPYFLKMDCEGCEYEVINYSLNSLLKFKYIIFEYHNANLSEHKQALNRLSKNLECHKIHYELFDQQVQGIMLCKNLT